MLLTAALPVAVDLGNANWVAMAKSPADNFTVFIDKIKSGGASIEDLHGPTGLFYNSNK